LQQQSRRCAGVGWRSITLRKEGLTMKRTPISSQLPTRKVFEMGREYPAGPKINFLLAIIGQMLPKLFPFDPLAFALENPRQFGDIAYYRVGPLRVYQLNSPELIRQILVEQPEKFHKPLFIKSVGLDVSSATDCSPVTAIYGNSSAN